MDKDLRAKGLKILAFPCNQFGAQEPGTPQEVFDFGNGKYGVEFPYHSKLDCIKEGTHPIYNFLRSSSELHDSNSGFTKHMTWNFAKFLVNG